MDSTGLSAKFQRACCISTFLATQKRPCDASALVKSGLSMLDLAQFKYLLPDEIVFSYEDMPFDAVFGDEPLQLLVFHFKDKRIPVKKLDAVQNTIKGRLRRFDMALQQFKARRGTLEALPELASIYLPKEDPFAENFKSPKISTKDHRTLFDEIHASLSNVITDTTSPAREARFGSVPDALNEFVKARGVEQVYSHQAAAMSHLLNNPTKHIVVSTATASGKSLIFQSLVDAALSSSADASALFIYPTKALAQDQLRSFAFPDAYTFDGDVEWKQRDIVKQRGRVLFLNPDILHTTLLPNFSDWARILSAVRYIVVDEMHYYSGVFGANVAMVLRRLRRICTQLGAEPCQFIGCSATVTAPAELMSTLTGLQESDIMEIGAKSDGSPSGAKRFLFCATDFMSPEDPTSGHVHPIKEAAPLMCKMVRQNMRVIAFCRFRRECELLLRAIYEADPDLKQLVMGYRGGYSPEDRRHIEHLMFSSKLRGIVATSALEVGIDIGNLDAALIVGFPHSVSSFRQQVGRVGRRQRDSLVVYFADGSVRDQFYASSPDTVLHGDIPRNPLMLHASIVRSHVQAAAYEFPMTDDDFKFFPAVDDISVAKLEKLENGSFAFPMKPAINLRKSESDREDTIVVDVMTNKILERVEFERVGFTLYEGGIYVHQGNPYVVTHLDADLAFAKVKRTNVKWTTAQRDFTDVDPMSTISSKSISELAEVSRGSIKVSTIVFGFFRMNEARQIIDSEDLNLPPNESMKVGLWLNLRHHILDVLKDRQHHIPGSIHAAEHAIVSILPTYVSMAPGDIGTECKAPEKEFSKRQTQRQRPARLIFYEKYGGVEGNDVLSAAFHNFRDILERACDVVDKCICEEGCGSCVAMGGCTEHNAVISKSGARVILRLLLSRGLEDIPRGPEPNLPSQTTETVVPVEAHTGGFFPQKLDSPHPTPSPARSEHETIKQEEF